MHLRGSLREMRDLDLVVALPAAVDVWDRLACDARMILFPLRQVVEQTGQLFKVFIRVAGEIVALDVFIAGTHTCVVLHMISRHDKSLIEKQAKFSPLPSST